MFTGADLTSLKPDGETVLTVGVFDGVHLGHKRLLSVLTKQAKEDNLISGVITFRQHPLSLLKPELILPLLTNLPQKINLLKNEGVDFIIPLTFTLETAQTGARHFVELLKKQLNMRSLVLGQDFALGRNQEGTAGFLFALSRDMDFKLTVVPHLKINKEVVSSTAIRKALAEGDIKKVNAMLGRYFSLDGNIITGTGRGMEIGFPTANIDIEPQRAIPADGVYATRAYIDNQQYHSVTNIGGCPTFGDNEKSIEVHIIDLQANLYRRELKIDIMDRLRGEKCFDSSQSLKSQIEDDVKQALAVLTSLKN
ncbi:bifunctional riboflavin kinase/FAD synthetase [Chloroflexota bacterium]